MSALTNFAENLLLTWLMTDAAAPTRPTAWYAALHTGDPGEAGDANEVVVGTDADYVRKAVTFADPVSDSGQVLSEAQVAWTANSGASTYTITHVSIWDASTAGNCLFKGQLLVPHEMVASGVFALDAGKIICALD